MVSLRSAEDWWSEVDARWDDINALIFQYAGIADQPVEVFVAAATQRDGSRNTFSAAYGSREGAMSKVMEDMRQERDGRLLFVFQSVWEEAPDNPVIHSWPYWHGLCDLCSEGPHCLEGSNED